MDKEAIEREVAQGETNMAIMRALGRIEGEVKGINGRLDKQNGSIAKLFARTDQNAKDISNVNTKIGVIGAVIGATASFLGNWFWRKLTGN